MHNYDSIPTDVRRFILTSIDSVPHLEALLMLRRDPMVEWDAKMMAQTLYMSEKRAAEILSDLNACGFISVRQDGEVLCYCHNPISLELRELVDRLADSYVKNLVEVTNLIHSKINKQAQQFGDAFKWQKEKDK
jgi:hypothetical protein